MMKNLKAYWSEYGETAVVCAIGIVFTVGMYTLPYIRYFL